MVPTRHHGRLVADRMVPTRHHGRLVAERMVPVFMLLFALQEAFILFDLIGSTNPYPSFYDMYRNTSPLFQRFVKIGKKCMSGIWVRV